MKSSITVKIPKIEIVESKHEKIYQFIKKHKQAVTPQIKKQFGLSNSACENTLSHLIQEGRITKTMKPVRLEGDTQIRNRNVYSVL